MNCYYHNDDPAVAQCADCGKYLCKECTDKGHYMSENENLIICEDCRTIRMKKKARKRVESYKEEKKSFITHIIIGIVLAVASAIIIELNFYEGSAAAFLFFFIPFGWLHRTGNETEYALRVTGNDNMSSVAKILNFLVKLVIAIVLGIPFFIRDCISLNESSKKAKQIY